MEMHRLENRFANEFAPTELSIEHLFQQDAMGIRKHLPVHQP